MNLPETAPKDGTVFLGDFGWPTFLITVWSSYSNKWVCATPQVDVGDWNWNDSYFENEWERESELKGWIELPKL